MKMIISLMIIATATAYFAQQSLIHQFDIRGRIWDKIGFPEHLKMD